MSVKDASREHSTMPSLARASVDPGTRPVSVSIVSTPRNRAALAIVLAIALSGILLAPFFPGLFSALVLYVISRRAYQRLAKRVPPGVAAATIITAVLVLVIVPLVWLISHLIDQAPRALAVVQRSNLLEWLNQIRVGDAVVGQEIAKAAEAVVSWLSGHVFSLVGSAQSVVINIMISLLGLYYLLSAPEGGWESVREYIPFSARTADTLRDRFVGVTQATILSTGVVVLAQGVLIAIAFAVTGLPDPVFWGAVALLTAFIPLVGSTLVWLPAALILLSQHRYGAAAVMLVAGGIAANTEELLRPIVYRRMTNIHPMITLVGALAGVRLFGVAGLLLGPLTIALVFELLRFFREEYVPVSEQSGTAG